MTQIGVVEELWRFPVKSMAGEAVPLVTLTSDGVLGDRAYAMLDVETGRIVSAKNVRQFPGMLACRSVFVVPPVAGDDVPPVRIDLPNGTSVRSDADDADQTLSDFFGRSVRLVRQAPADFMIDQHHPDLEAGVVAEPRGKTLTQKLGAALFAELGLPSPVVPGRLVDAFPLSLLSTSTLARLSALQPQTRFERERFRMNVIVSPGDPAAAEVAYIGRALTLGAAARVEVAIPAPRCVMTTLPQDGISADLEVLRALVRHNRVPVGPLGNLPCCGLYAAVVAGGELRVGDAVLLH